MARAIARMEQGNLSNVKPVGDGVLEYRIDFGPGYRVYFGRDGEMLVILLTGGTKKRQQRDIDDATGLLAGLQAAESAAATERKKSNGEDEKLQGTGAAPSQGGQEVR